MKKGVEEYCIKKKYHWISEPGNTVVPAVQPVFLKAICLQSMVLAEMYFQFLKWLYCMFFILFIVITPTLYIILKTGEYDETLTNGIGVLAIPTLGNLGKVKQYVRIVAKCKKSLVEEAS